jgi:hypothetical protein
MQESRDLHLTARLAARGGGGCTHLEVLDGALEPVFS